MKKLFKINYAIISNKYPISALASCLNINKIKNSISNKNFGSFNKLEKKYFAISNDDSAKKEGSHKNKDFLQSQNNQENAQVKENRIVIFTRELKFDKNGLMLLYKSEFPLNNFIFNLFIKKDFGYFFFFSGLLGVIFNFKLSMLLLFPLLFKYRKHINFKENYNYMKFYNNYEVITEIYIDKSLKKAYFNIRDYRIKEANITDSFLLTKEMSRITYDIYDNCNNEIYKIFAFNFILVKIDKEVLLFPIDGKIYDKELLSHVLKGRLIIKPEIPEIHKSYVANKDTNQPENNVYIIDASNFKKTKI